MYQYPAPVAACMAGCQPTCQLACNANIPCFQSCITNCHTVSFICLIFAFFVIVKKWFLLL
jgi:hypothetical protein